ncbi:MAG: sigma-70 family RNA polymerase sigma factor [Ruminococcus sp.]|nr:sigma-70 family RNA polymerase sigma factor [Ruminococcus sp.]
MIALYFSLVESEGDKEKFEQIYIRYKSLMLSRAFEILHDRGLSEDAVHNAFMRILKNLEKLDDAEHPRTKGYVMIVLENVAKTLYVKNKKQTVIELDENIAEKSNVEVDTEAKLTAEFVAEKIAELPDIYRDVLTLKYLHGLNDKEIAAAVGISPVSARKRLQRAREKLKRLVGGELYG